jgi:hypothetical protein
MALSCLLSFFAAHSILNLLQCVVLARTNCHCQKSAKPQMKENHTLGPKQLWGIIFLG